MTDLRTLLAVGLSILVVGFFHARADGPVNPGASSADVAALWAAMPLPANTDPVTDAATPSIGSITNRYQLPGIVGSATAVQPL